MTSAGIVISGKAGSGVQRTDPDGRITLLRPGPAGDPALPDDEHVIYRGADDRLHVCDLDGGNDALVLGPDGQPDGKGSSPLFAGAGHWMACLLGGGGIRTSWDLKLPAAAALGMSRDGIAFIQPDYQGGTGLAAYRPLQLQPMFALPQARTSVGQFDALDGGRCVWTYQDGRNVLQSSGLPAPQQVAPAYGPRLVDMGASVWITYYTQTRGLVFHRLDDASCGFVLTTADAFGVVFRVLSAGEVEIGWFGNEGEIGPMTRAAVRIAEAGAWPAEKWPSLGRKVGMGYFKVTTAAGSFEAPGHFEVLTDGVEWAAVVNKSRPIIADMKSAPSVPADKLYAIFAVVGVDDPARCEAFASRNGVPVIWYSDAFPFPDANVAPRPDDLLMLKGYPTATPAAIGRELDRLAERHPKLAIAWPLYLQIPPTWDMPALLAHQRPLFDVVRARLAVRLAAFFCGKGRAGGVGTYPALADIGDLAIAASDGLPDLRSDAAAAPPPVDETPSRPDVPAEPAPAPDPEPSDPISGGLMQITTGTYHIVERADNTLQITRIEGNANDVPAIDYGTYHAALERVTAARAARHQGPNLDIDAYRLIVDHHGDADALIARNNAEPA